MRRLLLILLIPLPSFVKIFLLRYLFRMKIGRNVRIGISYLAPNQGKIGDRVRIGHFNVIAQMQELKIDEDAVIGHANIILGGRKVHMGAGSVIVRFNEINSILNPLARGEPQPELYLGQRTIVTVAHKIDFTDRVELADGVVFAGRLSNIWTHNRQDVGPVIIGARCYVGSGVQFVPGTSVGADCVVGLGSIITKPFSEQGMLVAGTPARLVKKLDEDGRRLIAYPPRPDLDGYADLDAET